MWYEIYLDDQNGHQWALTASSRGRQGVVLLGLSGLATEVEHNRVATARQIGQRRGRYTVDAMTGTLDLLITGDEAETVLETFSAFTAGMSQFAPAVLTVITPGYGQVHTEVMLSGPMPMPERSPANGAAVQLSVPVIAESGCWHGLERELRSNGSVTNPGDLPMNIDVSWSGRGKNVVIGGQRLRLPDINSGTATYDGDPAVAGQVRVNGEVNVEHWRAMRAKTIPQVLPGKSVSVASLSTGVVVKTSPRYTTPWRWSD